MKDFDYYKNVKVPFPKKDDFTTVYVYLRGDVLFIGSMPEYKDKYPIVSQNQTVERFFDKEKYKEEQDKYYAEQRRLHDEFKKDLFEEFGVTNNTKAEKCYSLAWDYGNSAGYQEVYSYFSNFVELID